MEKSHNKFYALLALTAIIWGAQPVLVKMTIKEITPTTLTAFRFFLLSGTIFLIMFFTKQKCSIPNKNLILPLILMGICGVLINNIAQFSGLKYSTVTNATLISSTTPAITALLAATCLKERLLPLQWLGILISLSGTIFLVSHGSLSVILNISFNRGDLLFFFSQVAWAIYSLISIRVMKRLSALATTAWAGLFGAITTTLYGTLSGEIYYVEPSMPVILSLLYIIWIGGVCAMLFWNMSSKEIGASQASIFLNIMPVVGIFCGVFFLQEQFRLQELVGAAAILSGVYLTTQAQQITNLFHKKGIIAK